MRKLLATAVLGLAGLLLSGCAAGPAYGPYPPAPTPSAYEQLARDVEGHLLTNVLPAWYPRCIDRDSGGFYATFDRNWRRGRDNPKSIVFQARMTWVAATVAMEYPRLAGEYRRYAAHGARFLRRRMWDPGQGGFFWALGETLAKPTRHDHEKHLYGHAFGIYALARAYRATRHKADLELAVEAFRWMDRHAHDREHGGYFEALGLDGRPIPAQSGRPPHQRRSVIGALYGGYKSMNAHIHILEALTELYRATPDATVKLRLAEMHQIVRDRIAVEPGCLNQFFTRDWRPLPYGDSFGHDIETAFLLIEAAEALGLGDEPRTLAVARSLVDHALDYGWDDDRGGFYYEGSATSADHDPRKSWWVQAEGLNVLLLMHELFCARTNRYYRAFLKQWGFIDRCMIDHARGGWHEITTADGRPIGRDKAHVWKAAYHNVRALTHVAKRLRRLAARAPRFGKLRASRASRDSEAGSGTARMVAPKSFASIWRVQSDPSNHVPVNAPVPMTSYWGTPLTISYSTKLSPPVARKPWPCSVTVLLP